MDILIDIDGKRTKVTKAQLVQLAQEGRINPQTKIYANGKESVCGSVRGLEFKKPKEQQIEIEAIPVPTQSESNYPAMFSASGLSPETNKTDPINNMPLDLSSNIDSDHSPFQSDPVHNTIYDNVPPSNGTMLDINAMDKILEAEYPSISKLYRVINNKAFSIVVYSVFVITYFIIVFTYIGMLSKARNMVNSGLTDSDSISIMILVFVLAIMFIVCCFMIRFILSLIGQYMMAIARSEVTNRFRK